MTANWSTETYLLEQIPQRCKLPCLVQVSEGIYSSNEAESMSAGDIIKIDKHTRIPKVSANFTTSKSKPSWRSGTVDVFKSEIFVPLNYQGKVKIVNELKDYKSIEELAEDSPRYVELKKPLRVKTERKETLYIPTKTTIELERIIPGLRRGNLKDPDKLVITFDMEGENYTVAVPVDRPGQFQTLPDEMAYTLKEVVERYKLPQVVEFLKNDLRKVYIESLEDAAENVQTFTDTLRLNRVVVQEVLIGHYKPQVDVEVQDEPASHRTLVLLPMDSDIVREIEVNVLQDATEDDYERLSFVRKPVQAVDTVDEMIYVDFAKTKGLVRLENKSDQSNRTAKEDDLCNLKPVLPPRPPKSRQVMANITDDDEYEVLDNSTRPAKPLGRPAPRPGQPAPRPGQPAPRPQKKVAPTRPENLSSDGGDYIIADFSIASINFDSGKSKGLLPMKKSSLLQKVKGKFYTSNKALKGDEPPVHSPTSPKSEGILKDDDEETEYDYIDMDANLHVKPTCKQENLNEQTKRVHPDKRKDVAPVKPTAVVSPQNARPTESCEEQSFETLSVSQLYERLKKCGMDELAERCHGKKLDGTFIVTTDIHAFKNEPFNLSPFDITKLQKVKENWIPR